MLVRGGGEGGEQSPGGWGREGGRDLRGLRAEIEAS